MTAAPSIAARPKPHILVLGDVDQDIREHLQGLGSGVMFRDGAEDLRQADFAFIISQHATEAPHHIAGNATVLHFANPTVTPSAQHIAEVDLDPVIEYDEVVGMEYSFGVARNPGGRAVEFEALDGPYEGFNFRSTVTSTIAPHVEPGSSYYSIVKAKGYGAVPEPTVHPLFQERDGDVVAAIIEFWNGTSPFWSLPAETSNPLTWVKLFLEVQKRLRPEAFPASQVGLPEEWLTPAELEAQQQLTDYIAETQRLMSEREQASLELREQLAQATRDAEAGDRLLFTATDDALVDRVADTLRTFGFQVEDRDTHATKHHTSKKEDLRITHPGIADDWVALGEVKGFTKGAKANVIQQIQKAAGIFEGQNGQPPSALWYVVNHYRNDPVQARPEPLVSNAEEVAMFASMDGLVLDTRELFRLKRLVDAGELAPEDAARRLMGQRGVFKAHREAQLPT